MRAVAPSVRFFTQGEAVTTKNELLFRAVVWCSTFFMLSKFVIKSDKGMNTVY